MRWMRVLAYGAAPCIVFGLSFYITVSVLLKGAEDVVCPNIKGKSVEEAKRLVEAKGLGFSITKYERRRDVPFNHVTVQKPEADILTRKGRIVLTVVSEGPPLVEVPSLAGLSLEEAGEMLRVKGLQIEKVIRTPVGKPGRVTAQTPRAGENVLEGKGVVLFAGTGRSEWYLMPDINELNVTDFSLELEDKGIKQRMTYARGERIVPGAVVKTSVPPGYLFRASEEVEIRMNLGG
ncbi:MAG: PASTA domain-containing protein [Deltaproteobacteria bacterium]|nr:MAG: PASTA domain-containing protein [Deltaproteobacteria bacterium]